VAWNMTTGPAGDIAVHPSIQPGAEHLFVGNFDYHDGGGGNSAVYSVDAMSGRTQWRTVISDQRLSQFALVESTVIVISASDESNGTVHCLDSNNGARLWHTAIQGPLSIFPGLIDPPIANPAAKMAHVVVGLHLQAYGQTGLISQCNLAQGAASVTATARLLVTTASVVLWTFMGGEPGAPDYFVAASDFSCKKLWSQRVLGMSAHVGGGGAYAYVLATPPWSQHYLTPSAVYALDMANGEIVWNYTDVALPFNWLSGMTLSPDESQLYFYTTSSHGEMYTLVYCLHTSNHTARWKAQLVRQTPGLFEGPVVSQASNELLITTHAFIIALNLTTGGQTWNFSSDRSSANEPHSKPAVLQGMLFVPGRMQPNMQAFRWSQNS